MKHEISPHFVLSDEIYEALGSKIPVVALESTVITHGLPFPHNLRLAQDMETMVRDHGAIPATIALFDGNARIGLEQSEIEILARTKDIQKISTRDIAAAIAKGKSGGTTVAATMFIAYAAGIRVFATGGIGGVHRRSEEAGPNTLDVSADLSQLARTPIIVVCAGAKAILDLPATVEYLETCEVPVIGYGSDEFPGFFMIGTGLRTSTRADAPDEVVQIARMHWKIGMESAVLVVNPPPGEAAMSAAQVEQVVKQALNEAAQEKIDGQQVTPFLLNRVRELTGGESLHSNLALLKNNARLAAQIACAWVAK